MSPTLKALVALGGSATVEEINTGLVEAFGLSANELEATHPTSGALVVTDRMSWARSYLKYPGFVENPKRSFWVLTEAGRNAADWSDSDVRRAVSQGYANRQSRKNRQQSSIAPATDQPPEDEESWSDQLLMKLQSIEPSAFERLCQRLLREHGFTRVEVTGKSGDGGIDGQGVLRVNLVSFHVLFQCKRYKGSVSAGAIRDFRGAMQGRADKGLALLWQVEGTGWNRR